MPDESKRYQILLHMRTALLACAVAQGYHYTVTAGSVSIDPTDNLLASVPPGQVPFYQVLEEPGGRREYQPANLVKDTMVTMVYGRYDIDTLDPLARAIAKERMAFDIEKALTVDITRGGLCIDTRLGEPQGFAGIGNHVVIVAMSAEMRLIRTYGQA